MESYVAAVEIVADCGDKMKTFKPGDPLVGVLPGTLESMIRMGQAVAEKPVSAEPKTPKPIQPKGDK